MKVELQALGLMGLTPDIRWIGGSMGPTAGLDIVLLSGIEPQILSLPAKTYYFFVIGKLL
jgi:hypothetical protein